MVLYYNCITVLVIWPECLYRLHRQTKPVDLAKCLSRVRAGRCVGSALAGWKTVAADVAEMAEERIE